MLKVELIVSVCRSCNIWHARLKKREKSLNNTKKSNDSISVTPKKYRKIILHFINSIESPVVKYNRKVITDFSEQGLLAQKGIRNCRDFEILSNKEAVLGFHDHPNEIWITPTHIPTMSG